MSFINLLTNSELIRSSYEPSKPSHYQEWIERMRNKSEALINELSEMEQILEEMACSHEKSQKDFEELRASFERFKLDLKKDD